MLDYPPQSDNGNIKVAFFGPMASGKTYAANALFPIIRKASLAGPLKQTAKEYFGVTGKSNDERKILQELADDIKKWDNDVFTKRLLWEVYNIELEKDEYQQYPFVCDDLRFTHEADRLREHGFLLVRVFVDDNIRFARIAEKYPDTDPARFEHKSEKDWKNIHPDYTISGEGDEGISNLRAALYTRFGLA